MSELTGRTSAPSDTVYAIYRWLFGDEAPYVAGTEMYRRPGCASCDMVLVTR